MLIDQWKFGPAHASSSFHGLCSTSLQEVSPVIDQQQQIQTHEYSFEHGKNQGHYTGHLSSSVASQLMWASIIAQLRTWYFDRII